MNLNLKRLIVPITRGLIGGRSEGVQFHRWVAPTLKIMKRRKNKMLPQPEQKRSTYLEWNYPAELYAFGKRIGEEFEDSVLREALTDASYVKEEQQTQASVGLEPGSLPFPDNSQLAQQGGKLISNYILQYLSTVLPKVPQKYASAIKDHLMSEDTLSDIAKHLGMSDLILSSEYPVEKDTLTRSFKAVVGALAVSSGEDRACAFIRDIVVVQLAGDDLSNYCTPDDALSELSSALLAEGKEAPEPRLISVIGQNTILASYDVGVYCSKKMIGRGYGENADTALNMAACDALWKMWGTSPNRKPLPFKLELPPVSKFVST